MKRRYSKKRFSKKKKWSKKSFKRGGAKAIRIGYRM